MKFSNMERILDNKEEEFKISHIVKHCVFDGRLVLYVWFESGYLHVWESGECNDLVLGVYCDIIECYYS